VPTPHVTSFYELLKYRKFSLSSYFKLFLLILLGPFTFLPFKKVIQYSNEGLWWTIFTKNKIFLNTNGIDLSIIPLRNNQPEIIDSINLIGVANISFWHGYDRVIYAINYLINNNINYKIQFFIIGEGSELNNLILLTKKLNLSNHVKFFPMTKTDDLNYYFSISHLAVGSIGLHRKNLNLASELKAREYTAFGIPFIASGQDLDFKGKVSFRFESPLDNSFMYVVNLIDDIYNKRIVLPKKETIRKYAEDHLSMDLKVNSFLTL
jgi:glycosyltransferase involved in cell wall biosynthesis